MFRPLSPTTMGLPPVCIATSTAESEPPEGSVTVALPSLLKLVSRSPAFKKTRPSNGSHGIRAFRWNCLDKSIASLKSGVGAVARGQSRPNAIEQGGANTHGNAWAVPMLHRVLVLERHHKSLDVSVQTKCRRGRTHKRVSTTPAYSVTGFPATDRATIYLVIRWRPSLLLGATCSVRSDSTRAC